MTIILENTDRYIVESEGYGAAYILTRKQNATVEAREAYIRHGDDATCWREDYDSMCEAYHNPKSVWHQKSWNACLAELIEPYITD